MLVELSRGDVVESRHRLVCAVVDRSGPLLVWGDGDQSVIARSALKFVQALPLLRTGAAERFDVSDDELVLACSSHSGEPEHVAAVDAWLTRLDLDRSDLECGDDRPIGAGALAEHHRSGQSPAAVLNCCSGKHTGFLTVARHLGIDHRGYIEPDHPVQQLVTDAVAELTGHPLDDLVPGRDGCGVPTFGIPLLRLAEAMRLLVAPEELDEATAAASRRLIGAVPGREFWISGRGRHETLLGPVAEEPLLVKTGAEGVYMAALPARGVGIVLKAEDGAVRAAEAAVSALLFELGAVSQVPQATTIRNKAGATVGAVTVDLAGPTIDRR